MALNTTLFCLSFNDIRKEHSREEVERHVGAARSAMFIASQRWPGVESALELYDHLIEACMRAYDTDKEDFEVGRSPTTHESPVSLSLDVATSSCQSSPLKSSLESTSQHNGVYIRSSPGTQYTDVEGPGRYERSPDSESEPFHSMNDTGIKSGGYEYLPAYKDRHFDSASLYKSFPPLLSVPIQSDPMMYPSQDSHLGLIGDQYSQYMHAQYLPQQALQALSQEEQTELMQSLEDAGLGKD